MASEILESLNGSTDGINKIFTSSQSVGTSPFLYINGVIYIRDDTVYGYTVSENLWTITTPPEVGDILLVYYIV